MSRPRLLDLFSGTGGAAKGYHDAGFEVVGVDIERQPFYPFEFVRGDALTFPFDCFDAIHASPPCQLYSGVRNSVLARQPAWTWPDLLAPTRARLNASGLPYVIENVPGSPIRAGLLLCGTMFGLRVKRHRYFEANWSLPMPPADCHHDWPALLSMYSGGAQRKGTDRSYCDAMGITWAPLSLKRPDGTRYKLAQQAIPPVYTEHIGRALLGQLATTRARHGHAAATGPPTTLGEAP